MNRAEMLAFIDRALDLYPSASPSEDAEVAAARAALHAMAGRDAEATP